MSTKPLETPETPILKLSDCAIDLDEARGVIDRLEARKNDLESELTRWQLEAGALRCTIEARERELKVARAELAEIRESFASVMREECGVGERHCTCVPALRAEITQRSAEVDCLARDFNNMHDEVIRLTAELAALKAQPPTWGQELERPDERGHWFRWCVHRDTPAWVPEFVPSEAHGASLEPGRWRRALPPPMPKEEGQK